MDQKTIESLEHAIATSEKSEKLIAALSAFGVSIVDAAKRFESKKSKVDEEISRGSRDTKHRFSI